jgi:hypothetical protein
MTFTIEQVRLVKQKLKDVIHEILIEDLNLNHDTISEQVAEITTLKILRIINMKEANESKANK